MADIIKATKSAICDILIASYNKNVEKGNLNGGMELRGIAEIPKDTRNGDFAANHAMMSAKGFGMAPRKLAELLVECAELENPWFSTIEIAGPGFINFRLSPTWYADSLASIESQGEGYGSSDIMNGEKVMVEFVSANPTGPMHMGNARGGVLGDTLAELFKRCGAEVCREFYVNDAGNQLNKFSQSIEARYKQLIHGEDAVEFPEDGYQGEDIKDIAKAYFEQYGKTAEDMSEKERKESMETFGLAHNIPAMESDLERYGIRYDVWFRESSLHESAYVEETTSKLTESGHTYEKDGALWLNTSAILAEGLRRAGKSEKDIEKLELKDDVLRRANGIYTYFAADIAYHRDKLERRSFDMAINIWGADHHGHVARIKGAMDALGLDGEHRLHVVLMQLVKLMRDGETVRMSKRTGRMISLSDLLDEIPVDAARWFFNSRPDSQMDFDLGLAVRQDSENPVYYVQYAHARICSLIANLAEEGHRVSEGDEARYELLETESEQELIKQLACLTSEVQAAALNYDPSRINKFATETATRFHRFYTSCRLKGESDDLLGARLKLAHVTKSVLSIALSILGIAAPERM